MGVFKRIKQSKASRTAAAFYLAFVSMALWGLITIPIAVAFLDRSELGLWTVVNAFLQYFVWMDLGVGAATGRLMAESVVAQDQQEINRWWTATRAVLIAQGGIIIALGLPLCPLLLSFLPIPQELLADARWLLIGGVLITGLSLPLRGVAGLLTAQNRLHWVPLLQSVSPWVNLLVFYQLLQAGFGLKSYIGALAASQVFNWLVYSILIYTGPNRPRTDLSGLQKSRFGKLFKFSGNLTISGFSDTILQSLPALIIARLGGLGPVPIFNFSWKFALTIGNLSRRTYQSFYPGLQRLHVSGKSESFRDRHEQVGNITLAIALISAGIVLGFNSIVVQILAGPSFYIGPVANIAFALAMIIIPMSAIFRSLLTISGDLGKMPLIAILQLLVFSLFAYSSWKLLGLTGVAFTFALTPLCKGLYGYYRGTKNCGYRLNELSGKIVIKSCLAIVLVTMAGVFGALQSCDSLETTQIMGRLVTLPPRLAMIASSLPVFIGIGFLFKIGRNLLGTQPKTMNP